MEQVDWVIGLDPGVTGGWSITPYENGGVTEFGNFPLSQIEKINTRKAKNVNRKNPKRIERFYNLKPMAELFNGIDGKAYAFIELVNSMPREAAILAFKFGDCLGQLKGLMAGCGIPFEMVPPMSWQAEFNLRNLDKKDRKKHHIVRANEILMEKGADRITVHNDGEADSILIGEYGRRILEARSRQPNLGVVDDF